MAETCGRCNGEGLTPAGPMPGGLDMDMDVCDDCRGEGVV